MKFSKLFFSVFFILLLVNSLNVVSSHQPSNLVKSLVNTKLDSDLEAVVKIPSELVRPNFMDNYLQGETSSARKGITTDLKMPINSLLSLDLTEQNESIDITSDEELELQATSGNGTAVNPYAIEFLNVTVSSYINGLIGISIFNTTKHFVIRNCYVDTDDRTDNVGIHINDVAEGTANVSNNIVTNNNFGIIVEMSRGSNIVSNTLYSNRGYGIIIALSGSSSVRDNYLTGEGLIINGNFDDYLSLEMTGNLVNDLPVGYYKNLKSQTLTGEYGQLMLINCSEMIVRDMTFRDTSTALVYQFCNNSQIINCTFENVLGAIEINESDNSTLRDNNIVDTIFGILVFFSDFLKIENNTCIYNPNPEEEFGVYIAFCDNSTIIENYFYNCFGIIANNANYTTIANNTCLETQYVGIGLEFSFNSLVANNICNSTNTVGYQIYGSPSGISLFRSEDCIITNNSIGENLIYGIVAFGIRNCEISWNIIADHISFGVYLNNIDGEMSMFNIVHHNKFIQNNINHDQARDDGDFNEWYDETTNEGNWWSEVTEPTGHSYQIVGTADARDPAPLYPDRDGDGIPNYWENRMGLNPDVDDADEDPDGDGLTNFEEYQWGTHPGNTDMDGFSDGEEVEAGTNPLESYDYPIIDNTDPTSSDDSGESPILEFISLLSGLAIVAHVIRLRKKES